MRVKRYVAALLVGLGLVGVVGVLAVGAVSAKDENAKDEDAGAKCSEATLHGTYLFAQNGVELKGNDQRPFALAGYDVVPILWIGVGLDRSGTSSPTPEACRLP